MAEESDSESRPVTDPNAAFTVLSHDLRLEILLALWEAPGFSLSFSALREAVGERDSGKFTYHLSELNEQFVAETEDGYELQYPGHRVLDAIQSGVFHERAAVGPVALDADCRSCGATLTFTYDTDYIGRVGCPDCGDRTLEWPFDPGGIAGRSPAAVAAAFDRRTRFAWSCALDGVCPFCAGLIEPDLQLRADEGDGSSGADVTDHMYDREAAFDGQPAYVTVDCQRCSFFSFVPVGVVLLGRPAVTGRLYDAGLDVGETPLWDLEFVVDDDAVSLRSTDPPCVELTISELADPVTVVVDDSLGVLPGDET